MSGNEAARAIFGLGMTPGLMIGSPSKLAVWDASRRVACI
jgi:hypothetical protein